MTWTASTTTRRGREKKVKRAKGPCIEGERMCGNGYKYSDEMLTIQYKMPLTSLRSEIKPKEEAACRSPPLLVSVSMVLSYF